MKKPLFPLIDISKEGFLADNCFPVLTTDEMTISIKNFNKNFLNTIHYDSAGHGFRLIGYELISSFLLSRTKEIKLIFKGQNESIELNRLKELGIKNASQIYFLEKNEIESFKAKIYSLQTFRELIIHLSEYNEDAFE